MNTNKYQVPDDLETQSSADAVHAIMRFMRIVMHRKMYVVSSIVVAGLLGAFYYFSATPIYQADAQLLIQQSGPDVWSPAMTAESGRQALIPTYESLFSSSSVLEGAVERLLKAAPETRVDFAAVPGEKWVQVLRDNLTARAVRRTNMIEISYRSKSPQAAEAVVDAVVESYLDFMAKTHKNVSAEIVRILEKDRIELDQKISGKQQELLAAQRQVKELGVGDKQHVVHPAVNTVIRLNESLVEVQLERLQLEASLAAIRQAVGHGSGLKQHLNDIEPIIGREMMLSALGLNTQAAQTRAAIERQLMEDGAKLKGLLDHYGENHPKVIEVAQAIQSAEEFRQSYQREVNERLSGLQDGRLGPMLVSMVEEKLASLWEHENKLIRQYQHAESEAVQLNDRMAEKKVIERELDRLRNLHDTLLNRITNIDIGQDQSDVRATVVSEPKASDRPVSPKLSLVGIMCLLGGTGIGVAFVYVLDVLDDRFRSPEELSEQLGAPILAMVRELTSSATIGTEAIQVHVAPESVESEAFRTLRTTLAFSGQDMERIAVTSTEPGDGKTTVLTNLAVSCAQAGKKTLLIDADLRRPGLTKLFEMRGVGGLSEVLRGDGDIPAMCAERIIAVDIEGLDVLPCGPKPPNPTELLSSTRFADVLAWAEANYDQILVDCPPILAASDAALVGRLTEGLILVVQPEKNHRRLVIRAVNGLASIGVNLIGVVANKISSEKGDAYYGYGGYGYGYGYGYREEEPVATDEDDLEYESADADYVGAEAGRGEPGNGTRQGNGPIVPRRAA